MTKQKSPTNVKSVNWEFLSLPWKGKLDVGGWDWVLLDVIRGLAWEWGFGQIG